MRRLTRETPDDAAGTVKNEGNLKQQLHILGAQNQGTEYQACDNERTRHSSGLAHITLMYVSSIVTLS